MSIFEKFKIGFKKSAENISSGFREILIKKEIDDNSPNKIEEFLISSDVGIDAASEIRNILAQEKIDPSSDLIGEINKVLKRYIVSTMGNFEKKDFFKNNNNLNVILVAGVNGSGKTTTIGKIAKIFKENNFNQLIIDTAGRLQNKKNLMEEYKKIANVVKKIDDNAPNEVILVLDATSGQNILRQVDEFNKMIPITGLVMTKLDGTAKGGILLAIAKKYKLPIIALGLGEKEDDLQIFEAEKFAEAFTQIN